MTSPEPVTITLPPTLLAQDHSTYDHMTGYHGGISPVEECPVCDQLVEEDEPMRKIGDVWQHERCALAAITAGDVDAAWLTLADQVVARPSAFRASDVKAIMRNVAAIARRGAA